MTTLLIWILCGVGHLALWCIIFNRIHATRWVRQTRKIYEKSIIAAVLLIAAGFFANAWFSGSWKLIDQWPATAWQSLAMTYVGCCLALAAFVILRRIYRATIVAVPDQFSHGQTQWIDVQRESGREIYQGRDGKMLGRIPLNQSHQLTLNPCCIAMENLPPDLVGLKICQLSDFHFTGQISREYFERVVLEVNAWQPDLIVITGDLVDEEPCLDWIEPIFGSLKASHGVYFILGNHDTRIRDQTSLRRRLTNTGMVDVAGRWVEVAIGNAKLRMAGNEIPWYDDAKNLPLDPPDSDKVPTLKMLLSHSPDQIDWAAPYKFDLMFAGHNHGGQIVIPVVGPIIAPSKYGVKYAAGSFKIGSMLMHVSRGLSGDKCIRLNCPPEIGQFTLSERT